MLANKFDRGFESRMKLSANKPLGHTAEGFSLVNCFENVEHTATHQVLNRITLRVDIRSQQDLDHCGE